MHISKIALFNVTCPHCGTKIRMDYNEYKEFCEATEGWSGSEITCIEKDASDKNHEITYVRFNCPTCNDYIPMAVLDGVESDRNGFKVSNCVEPVYLSSEVSMEDYLKDWFGEDSEVDGNSEF